MFLKLAKSHTFDKIYKGSLARRYGETIDSKFYGISYYNISDIDTIINMYDYIPTKYRKHFYPALMVINRKEIPPHIDDGPITAVNFYVNTANAITCFYKSNTNLTKSYEHNPRSNGALFNKNSLTPVSHFIAKSGEAWMLDINKIHSVSCSNTDDRVAYILQSSIISYNELRCSLGEIYGS